MRYYKKTSNGKVVLIGTGEGGEEISATEYKALLEEIKNTPFDLPDFVKIETE